MARLFDIIARERTASPFTHRQFATRPWPEVPIIVADNISEYYMEGSDKEAWDIQFDFPNMAPPFDAFWIEARNHPRANYSGVVEQIDTGGVQRCGALFQAKRERVGWRLGAEMYWQIQGRSIGPLGIVLLRLDERGRWVPEDGVRTPDGERGVPVAIPNAQEYIRQSGPEAVQELTRAVIEAVKPLLLAVSFMHCKNVQRREVAPSQYENRYYRKKHRKSLVRYHVLDIDPMRKVLKTEGRSGEVGLKKALHICRGHFATYTEDKPLFGRLVGSFWKESHVRGSAKEGAVVKDYRVKAPRRRA